MGKIKAVLTLGLIFITLAVFSQQKDSIKVNPNHYTLTVGAGWTHYINNLQYGDQDIQQNFAGLGLKFFWEPEFRLSLGLETGYYKLFKITNQYNADTSIQFDRSVVPFLLLVRMRIVDNVYLGAGMGIAMVSNKSSGAGHEIITKSNSLANYEVSAGYIYPLSKHWLVGGEFKTFRFAGLNDWLYSIQATFAVKL